MDVNKKFGNIGEIVAKNYLKQQGLDIICCNYKNKIGEIDIIANDKEVLCFVEVKYRSSKKFGSPKEAINNHKIYKIKQTAIAYLKYKGLYDKVNIRFDCIELLGEVDNLQIEYIKNIF